MVNMNTDTIKNCPFCGGEAECYTVQTMQLETGFVVKCKNPDCIMCSGGTLRQTPEEAIEAWNNRKTMQNIVERLEEELELSDRNKRRFIAEKNFLQFDEIKGYANGVYNAIKIVKEEGGV